MTEHRTDTATLREELGPEQREAGYRSHWDSFFTDGTVPPLHRQLGLQIVQLRPHVVMTMELSDDVRGLTPGSIHGGMLASFADVAGAVSLWDSCDRDVEIPVTTDMHIRYYRQPKNGPLRADVRVVHSSPRLLSNECVITDAQERVLARATASYMIQKLRR